VKYIPLYTDANFLFKTTAEKEHLSTFLFFYILLVLLYAGFMFHLFLSLLSLTTGKGAPEAHWLSRRKKRSYFLSYGSRKVRGTMEESGIEELNAQGDSLLYPGLKYCISVSFFPSTCYCLVSTSEIIFI
jgi:hypothetical protein